MFISDATHYLQTPFFKTSPTQSSNAAKVKENDNPSFLASDSFLNQKKVGMGRILEKVEEDKGFAKEMVEFYKSTPDRPIFNLEEALSSPGGLAHIQRSEERRVGKECRSR